MKNKANIIKSGLAWNIDHMPWSILGQENSDQLTSILIGLFHTKAFQNNCTAKWCINNSSVVACLDEDCHHPIDTWRNEIIQSLIDCLVAGKIETLEPIVFDLGDNTGVSLQEVA